MSLMESLQMRVAGPNRAQRWVQRAAATGPASRVMALVLPRLDRVLLTVSGGRFSGPQVLTGLPVITVTATGARSGKPRETALVGIPLRGGDLALIGSNFGGPGAPAWVHNLRANPGVEVGYRGRHVAATARAAGPAEEVAAWERASTLYVGYANYRERVTDRVIDVLVLEPAAGP